MREVSIAIAFRQYGTNALRAEGGAERKWSLENPAKTLTLAQFAEMLNAGLNFRITAHYGKNRHSLLNALCDQYGSDKGELRPDGHPYPWPSHSYADYYERLFGHCRHGIMKVFECGLGTNNPNLASSMRENGKPGASLRVWRDYFPNAQIYGADIDRDILFTEDRIRTHYVDQRDPAAIEAYWQQLGETGFDFMLDDGLHVFDAGSCLFTHSIQHLAQHGIYVIEDVNPRDLLRYKEFFSKTSYIVDYVTLLRPNLPLGDNSLVVIRKG